jgi:L-ascorbate metabolism protein UlaG (beta-lactamase superfamily)
MPTAKFLGHSCFLIEEGATSILIDPFLTGNPMGAVTADAVKPTAILVSHAHNDHLGDAIAISQRTGAVIVANFEIATFCQQQGVNAHPMHLGGSRTFDWGWVKLTLAFHGSTFIDERGFHTLGNPAGLLLRLGGKTLYHAGDTALFGDMALIGRLNKIDLALLPIGDNFTMGPEDAVEAVKMLQPAAVVPMHYNTFDLIAQDPRRFAERVQSETRARCVVLEPGQSAEF